MSRLFGTDGLRGRANQDLTPELAVRVGLAAGRVLAGGQTGTVVLGRDTRESGAMLAAAAAAGLASAGWRVRLAGVMTSPGVAFLTTHLGAQAGCVISASHNPAPDNGIKFFGADGAKVDEAVEKHIEALLAATGPEPQPRPAPGSITSLAGATACYIRWLRESVEGDLAGMRIVLDCAHGAASAIAPRLFRALGADVIALFHRPDGRNINAGCGATHPDQLARAVVNAGADAGVAFDGDADRAVLVDERGIIRNGDHVLYLMGTVQRERGRLPGNAVVGTVMTNLGTERALSAAGIRLERTRVGDRDVYARMRALGATLGGEQSGHVIFLDRLNTGDGMLTALQVLAAARHARMALSALCAPVVMFPQLLINIPLRAGLDWDDSSPLGKALRTAESLVSPEGRILVRPSGTEPVLRVMLEAADVRALQQAADGIEAAVQSPGLTRQLLSSADAE